MIRQARRESDIEIVRGLFREYAQVLDFDLCFQDFKQELASLPGKYAPPGGCLLLDWMEDMPTGCVAVRGLGPGIGELKRLYVKPAFRMIGIGRRLVEVAAAEARKLGYRSLRLDTVPVMQEAIAMYRQMGFTEIPSYCENPIPGALFMEMDLSLTPSSAVIIGKRTPEHVERART